MMIFTLCLAVFAFMLSLFALGEQYYGKWFFGFVPKLRVVPNHPESIEPTPSGNSLTFRLPDPLFIDENGTAFISLRNYIEVPKGTVALVTLSARVSRASPEVFCRTLLLPEGYSGDLSVFIGNRSMDAFALEAYEPLVNVTLIPSFYKTEVK